MGDYGDMWRDQKRYKDSLFCGYCNCGRKLLRTWSKCACGEPNPGYQPKKKTKEQEKGE